MERLKNKVAVVYGNGAIGGAIAKAFAREGARVFLAGRTPAKLKEIADEILSEGGAVETAQVDSLNESAVEIHMSDLIKNAGKVYVSFNSIGLPRTGIPRALLTELSVEYAQQGIRTVCLLTTSLPETSLINEALTSGMIVT